MEAVVELIQKNLLIKLRFGRTYGLGGTFLGIGRYYWVKVCQAELGSIERSCFLTYFYKFFNIAYVAY